jgi:hypothetical protein
MQAVPVVMRGVANAFFGRGPSSVLLLIEFDVRIAFDCARNLAVDWLQTCLESNQLSFAYVVGLRM